MFLSLCQVLYVYFLSLFLLASEGPSYCLGPMIILFSFPNSWREILVRDTPTETKWRQTHQGLCTPALGWMWPEYHKINLSWFYWNYFWGRERKALILHKIRLYDGIFWKILFFFFYNLKCFCLTLSLTLFLARKFFWQGEWGRVWSFLFTFFVLSWKSGLLPPSSVLPVDIWHYSNKYKW